MTRPALWQCVAIAMAVLCVAGCSAAPAPPQPGAPVTEDAATRKDPVVIGRPARVFVFAGLGPSCETVAPPQLRIIAPPARGELEFRPGQATEIAASAQGTCTGRSASGTGVYYIAGPGGAGADRFTVEARLASGEVVTRTFQVTIVE